MWTLWGTYMSIIGLYGLLEYFRERFSSNSIASSRLFRISVCDPNALAWTKLPGIIHLYSGILWLEGAHCCTWLPIPHKLGLRHASESPANFRLSAMAWGPAVGDVVFAAESTSRRSTTPPHLPEYKVKLIGSYPWKRIWEQINDEL